MDIATLVVVFLLVTAATLASYALSHWSWVRGTVGAGWAATSIGTTMLLVAAAIVVLTFVFKGPLWQRNLGMEQRLREAAVASKEILPREAIASASADSSAPALPTTSHEAPRTPATTANSPAPAAAEEQPQDPAVARVVAQMFAGPSSPLQPAFNALDPWAATRCVRAYHPGSDDTEWKIENECDPPVGLIISGCDYEQECGSKVVPSKLQRSIPLDEQTAHGRDVRVRACFADTPSVIYLMGAASEERATNTWREQFEAARANDGCLLRIPY
jgi:hypothetical protein